MERKIKGHVFFILCSVFKKFPKIKDPVKATKEFLLLLLKTNRYETFLIALSHFVKYKKNIGELIVDILLGGDTDILRAIEQDTILRRRKRQERDIRNFRIKNFLSFGIYGRLHPDRSPIRRDILDLLENRFEDDFDDFNHEFYY